MIYLSLDELLHIAERVLETVEIRDVGLLESAIARPRARAFGEDAYPTVDDKAAALLHSIARNRALVDGNERLSLAGLIAFYGMNGRTLTFTNDGAYGLVMDVSAGKLDEVPAISRLLSTATRAR